MLVLLYDAGGTLTGYAIRTILTQGFNESSGARPKNQAVPRILVVLTDGQSGDDVFTPALEVSKMGNGFEIGHAVWQQSVSNVAVVCNVANEITMTASIQKGNFSTTATY